MGRLIMRGHFENDNPHIEIEVTGLLSQNSQKIKVMVDTGFNGHLQIPFLTAFPLGLSLIGVQQVVIADGSTVNQFVCIGSVKIDPHKYRRWLWHIAWHKVTQAS